MKSNRDLSCKEYRLAAEELYTYIKQLYHITYELEKTVNMISDLFDNDTRPILERLGRLITMLHRYLRDLEEIFQQIRVLSIDGVGPYEEKLN